MSDCLNYAISQLAQAGYNCTGYSDVDLIILIEKQRMTTEDEMIDDMYLEAMDFLYQRMDNAQSKLMKTLVDTRRAAEWFSLNPAGVPVPEWVDDAINDLDPAIYRQMLDAGYEPVEVNS